MLIKSVGKIIRVVKIKRGLGKQLLLAVLVITLAGLMLLLPVSRSKAADHRDGPIFGQYLGIDIDDAYLFLDPNDNSRVILAFDVSGPIVPPENANAGFFDHTVNFKLQIENTGDAIGDLFIDVRFTKQASRDLPQTATVTLSANQAAQGPSRETARAFRRTFTAPTTVSSATATDPPDPVITVDEVTGIAFFAGLVDDPFFFDLPAELRYRASRLAGSPDPTFFNRARDSFAGYNVMMIAFSIPASRLRGPAGNTIGLSAFTQRQRRTVLLGDGDAQYAGPFVNLDRMGIPNINTALIPYPRKDEYNSASTADDANGRFVNDLVSTLRQLGTDQTSINIFKQVAVNRGDMLRLNLSIQNLGPGGGDNPQAAFPNGRRPGDDVVDKFLTLINNRVPLGDNVNANDAQFGDSFPFFAPPTQPFGAGVIDDRTRN